MSATESLPHVTDPSPSASTSHCPASDLPVLFVLRAALAVVVEVANSSRDVIRLVSMCFGVIGGWWLFSGLVVLFFSCLVDGVSRADARDTWVVGLWCGCNRYAFTM